MLFWLWRMKFLCNSQRLFFVSEYWLKANNSVFNWMVFGAWNQIRYYDLNLVPTNRDAVRFPRTFLLAFQISFVSSGLCAQKCSSVCVYSSPSSPSLSPLLSILPHPLSFTLKPTTNSNSIFAHSKYFLVSRRQWTWRGERTAVWKARKSWVANLVQSLGLLSLKQAKPMT